MEISVKGLVRFTVQMRDLQLQILLGTSTNAVIESHTWETYIDKYIGWIFPKLGKILPAHSALATTLETSQEPIRQRYCLIERLNSNKKKYATNRVAKLITIPTETESLVIVETCSCSLITIRQIQMDKLTQQTLSERGLYEVCPDVLFSILESIFSKEPIVLKQICLLLKAEGKLSL